MFNKKEKVQILFSILGDHSQIILDKLSDQSAQLLMQNVQDVPQFTPSELQDILDEFFIELDDSFDSVSDDESLESSFSMDSDLGLDDAEDSVEVVVQTEPGQRTPEEIADYLSNQRLQIASFFLGHCEDSLRDQIREHLSSSLIDDLDRIAVDPNPISEKVFKRLYDKVMVKEAVEEDDSY